MIFERPRDAKPIASYYSKLIAFLTPLPHLLWLPRYYMYLSNLSGPATLEAQHEGRIPLQPFVQEQAALPLGGGHLGDGQRQSRHRQHRAGQGCRGKLTVNLNHRLTIFHVSFLV